MSQARRVGIVGVGHVGPHVANSLLLQGLADEIYLCDVNTKKTASEAQDLSDSVGFCPYNARVVDAGDRYEELAHCDVIVNAAGDVTRSAGDRDGELLFTTQACASFCNRVVDAGFQGVFVTISNPCDVVATEIWKLTGYDPKKVIGSGTGLDSVRLRNQIARATGVDPRSVQAYMIGEHGDTMFACWSQASFGGKPLAELRREKPERFAFDEAEVEHRGRRAGYVSYAGKGCTEYAVANAAARLIAAIFHDEHAILAGSTLLEGQYGESGIFTSAPLVVGRSGVEDVLMPDLSEAEVERFHATCTKIRSNLERLDWWRD